MNSLAVLLVRQSCADIHRAPSNYRAIETAIPAAPATATHVSSEERFSPTARWSFGCTSFPAGDASTRDFQLPIDPVDSRLDLVNARLLSDDFFKVVHPHVDRQRCRPPGW